MMAPFVGLGSIKFVPSLLYALPALNARISSAIEVRDSGEFDAWSVAQPHSNVPF